MKKLDLNTEEGQYEAGLFCAKHYWTTSSKTEAQCNKLHTRAQIYRIYSDGYMRLENERKSLEAAWYRGINEGKRIRK